MTGKRVPARTPYKKGQAQKYTRKKREASFEEDDERPVAKKAKGKAAAVDSDEEDGVGAPAVLDTSKHKDKNGDTYWNVSFPRSLTHHHQSRTISPIFAFVWFLRDYCADVWISSSMQKAPAASPSPPSKTTS